MMMRGVQVQIIIFFFLAVSSSLVHGEEDRDRLKQTIKPDLRFPVKVDETGLKPDFYRKTCPVAQDIVKNITTIHVGNNTQMPAKLIRLHYHDCFVRGCDASILLDVAGNGTTEKKARPNLSLGGYEVIDEIKTRLEEECPGVVSCADILALSARDSVSVSFGKDMWEVLTGRRDGVESNMTEANSNLPSPFANFTILLDNFNQKGLNLHDLVLLSSAHTLGRAHCGPFASRLNNFEGTGNPDPALNVTYGDELRTICGTNTDPKTTVEMDPVNSSTIFDINYFTNLLQKKGLFVSDAALITDKRSLKEVEDLQTNPDLFFKKFAKSMRRMGAMSLLTGEEGQIRINCRFVNAAKP